MPRENRKRGKKHKKVVEEEIFATTVEPEPQPINVSEGNGHSWIISANPEAVKVNPEAPFGYVDADVKAYFRTVDLQMRDWQEHSRERGKEDEETDSNEERRMFFVAALQEMSAKERQLATDPDTSVILERMAHSMDDFVRRVFVDSLAGSYETLVRHRFASHVCQTLLTLSSDTVARECRGIFPSVPDTAGSGELRTMTKLILDVCAELLPSFTNLIMNPFASHVMRALLLVLCSEIGSSTQTSGTQTNVRSKKSASWKAKQGNMSSMFDNATKSGPATKAVPAEFTNIARDIVNLVRENLGGNEVRALAANKVASPVLQMLLEVESHLGLSAAKGSLMDSVMVGIISHCQENTEEPPPVSEYLMTLLRDPTSSHLLETIVCRAPEGRPFDVLWSTYFLPKLGRLAIHPVANFVLARALERLSVDQLGEVCEEMSTVGNSDEGQSSSRSSAWTKVVRSSRTGVLCAAIKRAGALGAHEAAIGQGVLSAFALESPGDNALIVPYIFRLKQKQEFQQLIEKEGNSPEGTHPPQHDRHGSRRQDTKLDPLEPSVQGAILLQSLLRLSAPHNQIVIDGLSALSIEEIISLAHHPVSSRVLDVLLESSSVPFKAKRQFVLNLIGHYHTLVDDRIGSRVGDRCWDFADPYLKEKIGRSLISFEQFLAGSFYGKFFVRNLNLYLLQKKPEEWKNMQVERKRANAQSNEAQPQISAPIAPQPDTEASPPAKKVKRNKKAEDEIEVLFETTLGKKVKKGALANPSAEPREEITTGKKFKGATGESALDAVMGAIRAAPKDERPKKKRKRT